MQKHCVSDNLRNHAQWFTSTHGVNQCRERRVISNNNPKMAKVDQELSQKLEFRIKGNNNDQEIQEDIKKSAGLPAIV